MVGGFGISEIKKNTNVNSWPFSFLAATSSSRSDVVTNFVSSSVRSFVRPSLFFSLVSLKSVEHLECHKASKSVKWESLCVSTVFQGCFKGVSRVY